MADEISLDSTVRASADQISAELESDTAVLHFASGTYFGLDEVGGFIWKQLQAPVRVTTVRDAVVSEFDVAEATAESDLLAFLGDLQARGLLDIVG